MLHLLGPCISVTAIRHLEDLVNLLDTVRRIMLRGIIHVIFKFSYNLAVGAHLCDRVDCTAFARCVSGIYEQCFTELRKYGYGML